VRSQRAAVDHAVTLQEMGADSHGSRHPLVVQVANPPSRTSDSTGALDLTRSWSAARAPTQARDPMSSAEATWAGRRPHDTSNRALAAAVPRAVKARRRRSGHQEGHRTEPAGQIGHRQR
jgi:hypothetical protein